MIKRNQTGSSIELATSPIMHHVTLYMNLCETRSTLSVINVVYFEFITNGNYNYDCENDPHTAHVYVTIQRYINSNTTHSQARTCAPTHTHTK